MSTAPARSLRERLVRSLGERAGPLRVVVEEARRAGAKAYLVGGPVRDLLLGEPVGDLDLLVTTQLARIARSSAKRLSARVVLRPRFLTASIVGAGIQFDLSQARAETYPLPGALPQVRPAELEQDFQRRDFSINALALPLDARSGRHLLDPCGGLADLAGRRVRVLHPGSFRDDPTRMLRAARYCARLRFRLSPETVHLLHEAIAEGALHTLSPERIWHEIEKLLDEADVARAVAETERRGLFSAISPRWRIAADGRAALRRLRRARRSAPWPEAALPASQRACGLRVLLLESPARSRGQVLDALGLRGRSAREVELDLRALPRLRRALERGPSPGKLDALLATAGEPLLLLLYCAATAPAARGVKRYATLLRRSPSPIDGHVARTLGLEGPAIGMLLAAARQRSLDGHSIDAAWLRRWLARRRSIR